jgi:hypothetical protein
VPLIETRHDPESFGAGMLPVARSAALKSGIDAASVEDWVADIRSRTVDGEYFFAAVRFVFVGVKPCEAAADPCTAGVPMTGS